MDKEKIAQATAMANDVLTIAVATLAAGVLAAEATERARRLDRLPDFEACDSCKAKPGSPPLCNGCLHNRELIGNLKKLI